MGVPLVCSSEKVLCSLSMGKTTESCGDGLDRLDSADNAEPPAPFPLFLPLRFLPFALPRCRWMARSNRSILLPTSSENESLRILARDPSPCFVAFAFFDFDRFGLGAADRMEREEGSDGMDRVSVDVVTVGVDIIDKLGSDDIPDDDRCHRGVKVGEHALEQGGGEGGGCTCAPLRRILRNSSCTLSMRSSLRSREWWSQCTRRRPFGEGLSIVRFGEGEEVGEDS